MSTRKERAFELRKKGKSYNQISEEIGVAKSTLSNWFKGMSFSEEIKKQLRKEAQGVSIERIERLNRVRGEKLDALYARAQEEARAEAGKYAFNPLFVAAVAAYWGEGDKKSKNHVRLTNTDPKMIALFRKFLLEICKIPDEKIKGALFIYEDLDEAACKEYWARETGITQFHKTMILPKPKDETHVSYGTCSLIVSNTYLKTKMKVWIDQLPEIILQ
ncbi:hypothetical protein KTR10_00750 [Candidatus Kaiserbacteria bacterium]|nr:hypothetical protein [Candidatus Kaiserbacteria bacterium]